MATRARSAISSAIATLALGLALSPLGGCGGVPNFTLPVCPDDSSNCYCYQQGFLVCGTDPHQACVDGRFDPDNCGTCGHACPAGSLCNQGKCGTGCGALSECGGRCSDLATDPYNCGSCGNTCNGGCNAGKCGMTPKECHAAAPADDFNTTSCNGACVDPMTDVNNCGGCGIPCPCGCVNGACAGTMCNGACTDLMTDPNNCGRCGNVCDPNSDECQCDSGGCF